MICLFEGCSWELAFQTEPPLEGPDSWVDQPRFCQPIWNLRPHQPPSREVRSERDEECETVWGPQTWIFWTHVSSNKKNPHTFIHVLPDQTSRPDGFELIKSGENMTPHESGYTRVPGAYFWNQHSLQLWKTSNSLYANASTLQLSFFRTHCTKVQTELWVLPQIRLKVQRFLGRGESHVVSVMSLLTHTDRHGRSCSWTEAASVCSLKKLSRFCCISLLLAVRVVMSQPWLTSRSTSAGCDSGFGKATAQHLDALGFEVFATVLDLSGVGALDLQRTCSPRLTLLQVDITQPQQVQQALLDTKAKLGMNGTCV